LALSFNPLIALADGPAMATGSRSFKIASISYYKFIFHRLNGFPKRSFRH
jgi:hypothetical protein